MSTNFVWHSTFTAESAEALSDVLGCDCGTVPPQDYEGDVICLNPAVSEKFQWEKRKFERIVNDPRKFKKFTDKAVLKQTLGANLGTPVRLFCINGEVDSVYDTETNAVFPLEEITTNEVLVLVYRVLEQLGSPDFVALDGLLQRHEGGGFGALVLTNVVFGPALVDKPAVLNAVAETFGEDVDAELNKIVSGATKAEKKVLLKTLKTLCA